MKTLTLTKKSIATISMIVVVMVLVTGIFPQFGNEAYAASKPVKVKGVKITSKKTTGMKASWKKAKNAKKYQVAYKLKSAKKWKYKTTKKKACTLKKLKSGKKYTVKVRGISGKSKGKWSKAVSATTKKKTTTTKTKGSNSSKVTGVKVTKSPGDTLELKITWKKYKDIRKYEVAFKSKSAGKYTINRDVGTMSFLDPKYDNIKPDTVYQIKVRARYQNGYSEWSDVVTIRTKKKTWIPPSYKEEAVKVWVKYDTPRIERVKKWQEPLYIPGHDPTKKVDPLVYQVIMEERFGIFKWGVPAFGDDYWGFGQVKHGNGKPYKDSLGNMVETQTFTDSQGITVDVPIYFVDVWDMEDWEKDIATKTKKKYGKAFNLTDLVNTVYDADVHALGFYYYEDELVEGYYKDTGETKTVVDKPGYWVYQ